MSKKVRCNYCGGVMHLVQESYPDYPYPERYYECFDCGQTISIIGVDPDDWLEPDPDREFDEGEYI